MTKDKKESSDLLARIIASIGAFLAFYSLFEASARGARYGYEEALMYIIPALILGGVGAAMNRSKRVLIIVASIVIVVILHAFV